MCPEFFLAILYFFILIFVNYFVFQLLKKDFEKISFNLRFQLIFSKFYYQSTILVEKFYVFFKKENKIFFTKKYLEKNDILILSNLYKKNTGKNVFFELLYYQYASI